MAYGVRSSLEHAEAKMRRVSEIIAKRLECERAAGPPSEDTMVLSQLLGAVAYLHDAVRYLKDGVP